MLSLTEELMLLALNDEKGTVVFASSQNLPYGLASTLLLDLINSGCLEIKDDKMKIIDKGNSKLKFLESALLLLKLKIAKNEIKKDFSFKEGIIILSQNYLNFQDMIIENLILQGILKREAKKFLFLIKFSQYPTLDPASELLTRDNIHKSVLMNIRPEDKLKTLICIMYVCNLLDEVFPKKLRKIAKEKIEEYLNEEKYSKILKKVISELSIFIVSPIS